MPGVPTTLLPADQVADEILGNRGGTTIRLAMPALITQVKAALVAPDAGEAANLRDFGVSGTGDTDDTAAIKAWLECGHTNLEAPDGDYLIAAAGPDAGGVHAFVSNSLKVRCSGGVRFRAAYGLENDIMRIDCNPIGYSDDRNITVNWSGGTFDQRLQRNSTVIPFGDAYPGANPGASATADALSIRGQVTVNGVPRAGFYRSIVRDVLFLASNTLHWQSAGGDGSLFVDGSRHIHVSAIQAFGSRDLAIYCSGLASGEIEGGSCYVGQNTFIGCMFGASTKRLLSNVEIVDNIGYNTAVVCSSTHVTATGNNVIIARNIGHEAWRVVRATEGEAAKIFDNQSYRHGHLLEDRSPPTAIFNSGNACVSLEGLTRSDVHANRLVGLAPGFDASAATVYVADSPAGASTHNMIHANTADGCDHVVQEKPGAADNNMMWGNHGRALSGKPVHLEGASSIDRDGPLFEENATLTHTGTQGSEEVISHTLMRSTLTDRDRIRIRASGEIIGTAGRKAFALKLGGGVQREAPTFAATVEGNWCLDATLEMNTTTSQRLSGTVVAHDKTGAIGSIEALDFDTEDISIALVLKLGSAADSIEVRTFSLRLE